MTGGFAQISSSWHQVTWDPRPLFSSFKWTLAVIVFMWHHLWREDVSVVYNCYWSSPAQSFSGPTPSGLMTTFYCLRCETPPTWRARFPYLYPLGTGWPGYVPGTGFPSVASYDSHIYRNSDSAHGFVIKPQHGPHRNNRFQYFLYCCVRNICYGNAFGAPLPSNGRIHSFHNYGFQPSCHNNIRLVLIKIGYNRATVRPCFYVAVGFIYQLYIIPALSV
jgi:hypothetical protein